MTKSRKLVTGLGRGRVLAHLNYEAEHRLVTEPLSHEILGDRQHTTLLMIVVSFAVTTRAQNRTQHHPQKVTKSKTLWKGDAKNM